MKKYSINVHYDMVINVEVVAESIGEAARLAREQADRMGCESMECRDAYTELADMEPQELTERESHQMQAQAVADYVKLCCKAMTDYTDDREESRQNKRELADIAYRGQGLNWLEGMDVSNEDWQRKMFQQISDFEGINANGVCDRYARMVARREFDRRYKRTAKSAFAAEGLDGLSVLDMKQAWREGLQVLRRETLRMLEQDPTSRYDAQMVVRYYPDLSDRDDELVNLFIYYAGDHYETAWQHYSEKTDYEDYPTEEFADEQELMAWYFYGAGDHDEPLGDANTMTAVWVDC